VFDYLHVERWKRSANGHMKEGFPRMDFLNYTRCHLKRLDILGVRLTLDFWFRKMRLKCGYPDVEIFHALHRKALLLSLSICDFRLANQYDIEGTNL
jgi:hypothetical protein